MQGIAWAITLAAIAVIGAVFIRIAVLAGGRHDYGAVQAGAYRLRAWLFGGLLVAGVAIAGATLRTLPYAAAGGPPAQVVNAIGYQWYWEFDNETVTVGQPVEFRVTSVDVNHGFGIYDEATQLVAQVQAMPGRVNVLRHVFDRPGTYRIMCLEYCGIAHHDMVGEIEVQTP